MGNVIKLCTDGIVGVGNEERSFTRIVGGFGDDKPMFLFWQCGDLLGQKTEEIRQNFERNEENFDEGIDFVDLKSLHTENVKTKTVDITSFFKSIGITHHKYGRAKRWLAFSFSGMMKLVKISTTKESWNIYNEFLEDYFKTKAENKVLKVTLQEQIDQLKKDRAFYIGMSFIEQDLNIKREYREKEEEINNRIVELEKQLTEELTVEKYKVYENKWNKFLDSNSTYNFTEVSKLISTMASEEQSDISISSIKLTQFLRDNGILSKVKTSDKVNSDGKVKSRKYRNLPNKDFENLFNVVSVGTHGGFEVTQTKIKPKGIEYIYDLVKEKYNKVS